MYDFIIVGGGPAGSMAGKYLAQSGKKVLLIQKNFAFKKPCGGGLRMDAFSEFQLDTTLVKTTVNTIVIETKKRKIEFDITDIPLAVVDRVEFDEKLRQEAQQAGATLLEAKVMKVQVNDADVSIEVKEKKELKTFQAHYLIAADGVLSTVRKQLRQEEVPKILTHYSDIEGYTTKKCHFYFGSTLTNQAYAWRFPYYNGADVGTLSRQGDKTFFYNLLAFLGLKKEQSIKGYNIPKWEKPLFYENRVFYVGDAAGQVLPFTYEGIYYAMKSAKILSEVIHEGSDFSEYEKRWNKLYYKKFNALKQLQRIFLKNDLMIFILMKTLEKERVKKKTLELWMDQHELKIDIHFFIRTFKRLFH